MNKNVRVKNLSAAVVQAFQHAGLTPQDLLQGPITHTDLVWQAPPLRSDATLRDLPMSTYLDYPVKVDPEAFYNFYCEGLAGLSQTPERMLSADLGWKGFSSCTHNLDVGERLLRFTMPEGFPDKLNEFSGHRFALECAHFAKLSVPLLGATESETSHWVETEFGTYGIVDGLPTVYSDMWDVNCGNQVDSFLREPRGFSFTNCHYDVLARVRSCLYENMDKFEEFEGVDQAVQALRLLTHGRTCSELVQYAEHMPQAAFVARKKMETIDECLEIMGRWSLTDRTKLSMLFERLVPEVYNMRQYQMKVIDPYKILPSVLSLKTENRIVFTLKQTKEKLRHANQV